MEEASENVDGGSGTTAAHFDSLADFGVVVVDESRLLGKVASEKLNGSISNGWRAVTQSIFDGSPDGRLQRGCRNIRAVSESGMGETDMTENGRVARNDVSQRSESLGPERD